MPLRGGPDAAVGWSEDVLGAGLCDWTRLIAAAGSRLKIFQGYAALLCAGPRNRESASRRQLCRRALLRVILGIIATLIASDALSVRVVIFTTLLQPNLGLG
jgi:hypothetical protein